MLPAPLTVASAATWRPAWRSISPQRPRWKTASNRCGSTARTVTRRNTISNGSTATRPSHASARGPTKCSASSSPSNGSSGTLQIESFRKEHLMTQIAMPVGPQRYRESFGRYFEDFEPGAVYEHRPGRTLTETDNMWFTLLTMNTHPLHFDNAYAAKSEFKQALVNSCLTLSVVVGMSVSDVSQKAIGNLGWNDIRLSAPVFVGDTLYAASTVLSKRESA